MMGVARLLVGVAVERLVAEGVADLPLGARKDCLIADLFVGRGVAWIGVKA